MRNSSSRKERGTGEGNELAVGTRVGSRCSLPRESVSAVGLLIPGVWEASYSNCQDAAIKKRHLRR